MIAKILSDNLTYAQVNSENPNICFLHGWGGESNNWKNISKELIGYDEHFNNFVALNHKKKLPKVIMLTGKKGIGKSTLIFQTLWVYNRYY